MLPCVLADARSGRRARRELATDAVLMCGVFGAALPAGEPTEAANVAALGLFALQHRGQESAGWPLRRSRCSTRTSG